jgi:hypothetical protein
MFDPLSRLVAGRKGRKRDGIQDQLPGVIGALADAVFLGDPLGGFRRVRILRTLRLGLAGGVSTFAVLLGNPLGCFGVRILHTPNVPICPPAAARVLTLETAGNSARSFDGRPTLLS